MQAGRLVVGLRPAETDELESHSRRAWRRKMPSAAARPAEVRCSSRAPAWATSPSAARRLNISLAACVVTPRRRPTCDAVTRESSPVITRRVSRYSWAADERSPAPW
jgi:hypothetical protein